MRAKLDLSVLVNLHKQKHALLHVDLPIVQVLFIIINIVINIAPETITVTSIIITKNSIFLTMLLLSAVQIHSQVQQSVTSPNCLKSACIRSYSGPHFLAFGLNMERYSVYLRIQSE